MTGAARDGGLGRFPPGPLPRPRIQSRLDRALREDWDYREGRIFGSMCTQPLQAAERMSAPFLTANTGNPGLCPGTVRLEEEVVGWLRELYHAPLHGAGGMVVSGGTEANITALWLARNISGQKEVVVPRSAHFSVAKALDLLSLKPRWVETGPDGRVNVEGVRKAVTSRTALIVAVGGSTELGVVDPIDEISEIALHRGTRLHVDAAFGGFVLPFMEVAKGRTYPFDFAAPGVTSLSVDPHKMGGAPIPAGALLLRNWEEIRAISVESPYLSAPTLSSLYGTRPSRNVAAIFSAMSLQGRRGYQRTVQRVLELTRTIAESGREMGLEPVIEPVLNIVALRHRDPVAIQNQMLRRGWDVSAIREPRAIRFVVMPHASAPMVRKMLKDLAWVVREIPN